MGKLAVGLVAATTLLCLGLWLLLLKFRSLEQTTPRPLSSNVRIASYDPAAEYFDYIGQLIEDWQESHGYLGAPLHIVFSESLSESSDVSHTLAVNVEHTVVAEGSYESIEAPHYLVEYNGRKYHVRLLSAERVARRATALLDYSAANVTHVAESALYPEVSLRHRYVASAIFGNAPLALHTGTRRHGSLSTFVVTTENPRRGPFLSRMPSTHINETGVWGKGALRQLYLETKVLVNVHQTDFHRTLEELRVLPALLCGVIVVSEAVPLEHTVCYRDAVIFEELEEIPNRVREVLENYEEWHDRLFNKENVEILSRLHDQNRETLDELLCDLVR